MCDLYLLLLLYDQYDLEFWLFLSNWTETQMVLVVDCQWSLQLSNCTQVQPLQRSLLCRHVFSNGIYYWLPKLFQLCGKVGYYEQSYWWVDKRPRFIAGTQQERYRGSVVLTKNRIQMIIPIDNKMSFGEKVQLTADKAARGVVSLADSWPTSVAHATDSVGWLSSVN